MERDASLISKLVAAELRGWAKKRNISQKVLSDATDINPTTLQRLLAGKSEINMDQLDALSEALGVPVPRIMRDADEAREEMSQGPATPISIDTKRKQNEAQAMSVEQIETMKHAATRDPELDADEPE